MVGRGGASVKVDKGNTGVSCVFVRGAYKGVNMGLIAAKKKKAWKKKEEKKECGLAFFVSKRKMADFLADLWNRKVLGKSRKTVFFDHDSSDDEEENGDDLIHKSDIEFQPVDKKAHGEAKGSVAGAATSVLPMPSVTLLRFLIARMTQIVIRPFDESALENLRQTEDYVRWASFVEANEQYIVGTCVCLTVSPTKIQHRLDALETKSIESVLSSITFNGNKLASKHAIRARFSVQAFLVLTYSPTTQKLFPESKLMSTLTLPGDPQKQLCQIPVLPGMNDLAVFRHADPRTKEEYITRNLILPITPLSEELTNVYDALATEALIRRNIFSDVSFMLGDMHRPTQLRIAMTPTDPIDQLAGIHADSDFESLQTSVLEEAEVLDLMSCINTFRYFVKLNWTKETRNRFLAAHQRALTRTNNSISEEGLVTQCLLHLSSSSLSPGLQVKGASVQKLQEQLRQHLWGTPTQSVLSDGPLVRPGFRQIILRQIGLSNLSLSVLEEEAKRALSSLSIPLPQEEDFIICPPCIHIFSFLGLLMRDFGRRLQKPIKTSIRRGVVFWLSSLVQEWKEDSYLARLPTQILCIGIQAICQAHALLKLHEETIDREREILPSLDTCFRVLVHLLGPSRVYQDPDSHRYSLVARNMKRKPESTSDVKLPEVVKQDLARLLESVGPDEHADAQASASSSEAREEDNQSRALYLIDTLRILFALEKGETR